MALLQTDSSDPQPRILCRALCLLRTCPRPSGCGCGRLPTAAALLILWGWTGQASAPEGKEKWEMDKGFSWILIVFPGGILSFHSYWVPNTNSSSFRRTKKWKWASEKWEKNKKLVLCRKCKHHRLRGDGKQKEGQKARTENVLKCGWAWGESVPGCRCTWCANLCACVFTGSFQTHLSKKLEFTLVYS